MGLKESAFEPSSPARHSAELCDLLITRDLNSHQALFIYCDAVALIID